MKRPGRRQAKPGLSKDAETSTNSTTSIKFAGTKNKRAMRAIRALLKRPRSREQIDRIAGCSNGPGLIAYLRALGLGKSGLPCRLVRGLDRDGHVIRYGVYFLSESGRRAVNAWLRTQKGGAK